MKAKKYIFIFIISVLVTCISIKQRREKNIDKKDYLIEKRNVETEYAEKTLKQYSKEEIIENYKGYKVCAKLEIPAISLKINVLSEYSKDALKISCTKFWGVQPNQEGNFCIAGHNYKNMFYGIKKLQIGDTFFITDNEVGKVEYEIFNIDKVEPENIECLDAITTGEKEVTLITCTNDSQKRIIVKAKEKL